MEFFSKAVSYPVSTVQYLSRIQKLYPFQYLPLSRTKAVKFSISPSLAYKSCIILCIYLSRTPKAVSFSVSPSLAYKSCIILCISLSRIQKLYHSLYLPLSHTKSCIILLHTKNVRFSFLRRMLYSSLQNLYHFHNSCNLL